MIKLNRTTEYGLVALRHISLKHATDPGAMTSAREVADHYGLPFEITAKTMQRLKELGLISSEYGARGGYVLRRSLDDISLAEFLTLMEGKRSLVACTPGHAGGHGGCEYQPKCKIRGMMADLNLRMRGFLSNIKLSELAGTPPGGGVAKC